ncbi:MAG: hypothetical protein ACRDF6_06455, partial [bacterium]
MATRTTMDPVTVTHGNLQLHITSCDAPPAAAISSSSVVVDEDAGAALPAEITIAIASPEPDEGRYAA